MLPGQLRRVTHGAHAVWACVLFLLGGCATGGASATIEPPAASNRASQPSGALVLPRGDAPPSAPEQPPVLHTGDQWWAFRGRYLGLTEEQAKERDSRISEARAPRGFWDSQTAYETGSLWSALCNECHGGRRQIGEALSIPPPDERWGDGEGLFFGKRRPYGEVFNVIFKGGPPRNGAESDMPAWKGKIAREEIWALVYFLEYESGGLEGRLPPSLSPRRGDNVRRALE